MSKDIPETENQSLNTKKKNHRSNRQSNLIMIGAGLGVFMIVIIMALLIQRSQTAKSTDKTADILSYLNTADQSIDAARANIAGIENHGHILKAQLDTALAQIDNLKQTQLALVTQAGEAAQAQTQINAAKQEIDKLTQQLESSRLLLKTASEQRNADASALEELAKLKTTFEAQKKSLADMTEQRDLLRKKLSGGISTDEAANLRKELLISQADADSLRLELQKLRAQLNRKSLYVEDASNLSPLASALYTELEKLEGSTPASLRQAYKRIDQDINASRIDLVAFQTGSSAIDTGRVNRIAKDIAAADAKSFFLVVGYASESGNSTANRALSAKRATAVASVIDSLKKPGNKVQAVYLGETDRFSPDSLPRNQVCEIWEIKPITRGE